MEGVGLTKVAVFTGLKVEKYIVYSVLEWVLFRSIFSLSYSNMDRA